MEKIKTIIEDYCIWGIFIGFVTLIIKPFITIKQSLRDMLITFIVSMLAGLLTEYIDIPQPVKYGISGVCGLFAVRLYPCFRGLTRGKTGKFSIFFEIF